MLPLFDSIPSRNTPVVTFAVIGACSLVFFLELQLGPDLLERFFYLFGVVPARYTDPTWAEWFGFPAGDYWPFLTSMFLHAGWMHILGNMWTLWIFGDNVEDRLGPVRFATFYAICGIAASLVHWFTNPDSTVPAVGASGAISGVMGAYLLLFPASRLVLMVPVLFVPFFFELPAVVYLGIWYLLQLVSGTFALSASEHAGGVAFWAHVGGFVAGVVLLPLFLAGGATRPRELDEYHMEAAWRRSDRHR